jgi:hypothetical protein
MGLRDVERMKMKKRGIGWLIGVFFYAGRDARGRYNGVATRAGGHLCGKEEATKEGVRDQDTAESKTVGAFLAPG